MDQITKINLDEEKAPVERPYTSSMEEVKPMSKSSILIPLVILGIIAGSASGFFFAKKKLLLASGGTQEAAMSQNPSDASAIKPGDVFGSADEKTFRDPAEGIVQPGGASGEGSHHLVRGADKSQWVYLTSSVVDLDNFVGHKVTVWGETVGAKKAGWLMDVGKLKVIELNAAEVNAITGE